MQRQYIGRWYTDSGIRDACELLLTSIPTLNDKYSGIRHCDVMRLTHMSTSDGAIRMVIAFILKNSIKVCL